MRVSWIGLNKKQFAYKTNQHFCVQNKHRMAHVKREKKKLCQLTKSKKRERREKIAFFTVKNKGKRMKIVDRCYLLNFRIAKDVA